MQEQQTGGQNVSVNEDIGGLNNFKPPTPMVSSQLRAGSEKKRVHQKQSSNFNFDRAESFNRFMEKVDK